jgi:hypothetical protein
LSKTLTRLALAVALAGTALLCASPPTAAAPHAEVTQVMVRDLPDHPARRD